MKHLTTKVMASKHQLSGIGILLGTNTLSAQVPAVRHSLEMQAAEMANTVQLLEQHALTGLIALVALAGLTWIAYLCHTCLRLNKSQQPAHTRPKNIVLFVFGLSVLCCQCSPAQLARASAIQAAHVVESKACPSSHHAQHRENKTMNYQPLTRSQYSFGHFITCKYCGQRVFVRQ
ncbi:MAG: hypothetical protein IT260_04780 [Saprospiraceae bacterium]|nr:hypothetical protein [Saprospiraceae bacterium]